MYNVYVTRVKNIRPAENADRLNLCEVFGNTTVVDKSVNETDLYIYFPVDGQISKEFGEKNNLFRKKDSSGNDIGGFIDPVKRNIKAIRLRGNKSDGLILPISSLSYFGDISKLEDGDIVSIFNGKKIACKYIPNRNNIQKQNEINKTKKKKKAPISPLFLEHVDTEQLAYNLSAFKPNDEIEITLKMHGTSQRTGYLPVFKKYKKSIIDRIIGRNGKPVYEYDYVSGTRRTVLENFKGGFYGNNSFRQIHHDKFVGKLMKGETVYYEVVGFTDTGAPIMGNGNNSKLGKDFIKQYGKETVFSYGCGKDIICNEEKTTSLQSDIYVYRMTITNEDGFVVEYTPDFMRYRCEQIGVKCVPVFARAILPDTEYFDKEHTVGNYVKEMAEQYYDGADPIGETHIREGVVVRILNRPKFTAYKHKNFSFKVLEGIIKDSSEIPDMEEAEELK